MIVDCSNKNEFLYIIRKEKIIWQKIEKSLEKVLTRKKWCSIIMA